MFAHGTGREYQRWGLLIIRRMGPWKKKNVFCRALPKIKLVHFFLNTITGIKTTVQSSKHWHFWRKKTPFFIPKMQLVKKTQEIRPMPASKHSFYSGPFPVSDLSQVWMGSKRGLSLSWVCLVYDKARQHCTGATHPTSTTFLVLSSNFSWGLVRGYKQEEQPWTGEGQSVDFIIPLFLTLPRIVDFVNY